jgi:hypothetical protein
MHANNEIISQTIRQTRPPMIPQFINECIIESENNQQASFEIIDAFTHAEKHYGKLNYNGLFYINEIINSLIETDILTKKGNSLHYSKNHEDKKK